VGSGLDIEIVETIEHDTGLNTTEILNLFVSKNVQYVICQTIQSPVADLLKAAAPLGVTAATFGEAGKITFLGAHYTGGADLISLTGASLKDYYWITAFLGTSQASAGKDKQLALAAKYNRSDATANSYFYANGIMVAQLVTETIKRVKSKGLEVTRDNLKIEMDQMNGENAFHPYTTVGPVTFSNLDHAGVNTLQMYNIQEGVFKPFGEAFITEFL
jgi:branched-chain amino acid transport system substrate-binding protein